MKKTSAPAILDLIDEIIETFRQLRVSSAEIHGDGAPMPGQRGVLMDLSRKGMQTVASMARARGVSRQNIQVLVDGFRSRRLVELIENPAHLRSKLVRLTPEGKALVRTMVQREAAVLRSLNLDLPETQIRRAAFVIHTLREGLLNRVQRTGRK